VAVVILMFRTPGVGTPDILPVTQSGETGRDITIEEWELGIRRLMLKADSVHLDNDGEVHFENIPRVEVAREGRAPLLISAKRGSLTGSEGQRLIRLAGGVDVEDEYEELRMSVDALEVNQATGEARSIGEVKFSDPRYHGSADSVVYGLRKQPSVVRGPVIEAQDGSVVRAGQAKLLDGTRDVLFEGGIHISDPTREFRADRMQVQRRDDGSLRHMDARDGVRGRDIPEQGPPGALSADRVEAYWGDDGEVSSVTLEGNAVLSRGSNSIAADRIWAVRAEQSREWSFSARGTVAATSRQESGPAVLSCDQLVGRVDSNGDLVEGEASGNVQFEAHDGVAAGVRALFDPTQAGKEITLFSSREIRARMFQGRSRVTADTIRTNADGSYLLADGHVEASLLPAGPGEAAAAHGGLFDASEAIHFVSRKLEGNPRANQMEFIGAVRGWQGERNLKADRVRLDQGDDTFVAEGQVSTRLPRTQDGGISDADYIQIAAERLDYSGSDGIARYTRGVRVRLAEGFLDARELEVQLVTDGKGVKEIRAKDDIAFEFRAPDSDGKPQPVTGKGDRLIYNPEERVMTLFGDRAPASVRRSGSEGQGVTKGRVLRYYLATGALEVQSGDRDRATIQTSGSPGN
jgi:lipopolysaccharide export system protein LptA